MKIGILGASFDPPHKAHFAIASAAVEFLGLDKILFIPAFVSPLKKQNHEASFEDRFAMLGLALSEFKYEFEISDLEKSRGGLSYSVDTAKALHKQYPLAELFWLIGTDQLVQLDKWKDIDELSKLVKFACFKRPNYEFKIPETLKKQTQILNIPFAQIDLSSSDLREAFRKSENCLDLIDAKVINYIKENKLYNNG